MATGLEYCQSAEKLRLDDVCREALRPLSRDLQARAIRSLQRHFPDGTEMVLEQERVWGHEGLVSVNKLKTMRDDDGPADPDDFNKNNRRIVSPSAHVMRDLGIDELPQIDQLGRELSMVGPRAFPAKFQDYALQVVQDKSLAEAWLKLCDVIRPGLTGPGQLQYLPSDVRDRDMMRAVFRADLKYYRDRANRWRDIELIAKTPFPLISSALIKARQRRRAALHPSGQSQ